MGETTNYKLYIESDSSARFQDWREKMNGENDYSNIVKIDTILGSKADKSKYITATLKSNAWSGVDSLYTQTIDVDGLTAEQNGQISVAHNATIEQRDMARNAILAVIDQSDGSLTIAADGKMPDLDIPVIITLFS